MTAAIRIGVALTMSLSLLAGVAIDTQAGTVVGSIDLPPRPTGSPTADLYGKYCGHCTSDKPITGVSAYAVVSLRPRGDAVPVREAGPTVTMDQNGTRFVPRVVPIQVGDSVRFLNSDPIFHNVFSLSPAKKFDLGRYPKGQSKVLTFDDSGVIQVFCDIHAEMVGFVVVVDSPYYTVIGVAGHYDIPEVPEGEYDVLVWSEGMTRFATVGSVEVSTSGSTNFTASLVERP